VSGTAGSAGACGVSGTTGTGSWDSIVAVSGSDATTTGQSLVDVTGLVVAYLAAHTYEFEAVLKTVSSADTTGMKVGFHVTTALVSGAIVITGTTAAGTGGISATSVDSAEATAFNTASAANGIIVMKGEFVSNASTGGNLSIQHLKVTSGTSTVKIGSSLKIRQVA
jgi:hypothetical protein